MEEDTFTSSVDLRRVEGELRLVARCYEAATRLVGRGVPVNDARLLRALLVTEPDAEWVPFKPVYIPYMADSGDFRFEYAVVPGLAASRILRAAKFPPTAAAEERIAAFEATSESVAEARRRAFERAQAAINWEARESAKERVRFGLHQEGGPGAGSLSLPPDATEDELSLAELVHFRFILVLDGSL